jgi:hypothetical protein
VLEIDNGIIGTQEGQATTTPELFSALIPALGMHLMLSASSADSDPS